MKLQKLDCNDTIAAISTPVGEGGIGIVRLSGKDAVKIASKIFVPARKGLVLSKVKGFSIHYGHIVEKAACPLFVDEVLLTVMRAPKTYTREDVVEINCHGGIVVLKKILDLIIRNNARLAEPGEFTKRAFLNGRIDLSQAEAVTDIINAKTDLSLRIAIGHLEGDLSKKIRKIKEKLVDILTQMEISIDFCEEDIEIIAENDIKKILTEVKNDIKQLIDNADYGIVLREGILMVIAGRPNVGKSSLMNLLLKQDRSIVTHIPGTTRDVIEETVNIKGIPLRIVDTAGITHTDDIIEKEGVNRSETYLKKADIVLLIFDGSKQLTDRDKELIKKIEKKKTIAVINKTDLAVKIDIDKIKKQLKTKQPVIQISVKKELNIKALEKEISDMVWGGKVISSNELVVSNLRHKNALRDAYKNINQAYKAIEKSMSTEYVISDVRRALNALAEIIGEIVTDDILDRIFSQFCIGK